MGRTLILLASLLLVFISFGGEPPTTRPSIDWGDTVDGWRIGIDTSPRFNGAGSAVDVVVYVSNSTDKEKEYVEDRSKSSSPVRVCAMLDNFGQGVQKTTYNQDAASSSSLSIKKRSVAAHESVSFKIRVNRYMDMSLAGRYFIWFDMHAGQDGDQRLVVSSKQLLVFIADSDEEAAIKAREVHPIK